MANESWLELLTGMLGNASKGAADATGEFIDDAGAIYQGYEDTVREDPFHNIYGNMVNRASQEYTGRPIVGGTRDLQPVSAGVSRGEMDKASTKLMDAVSRRELLENEEKMFQNARLEQLIKASTAAEGDVFVGDESGTQSGAPKTSKGKYGSFSKSNKPIAEYGDSSVSEKSFQEMGLPAPAAKMLNQLAGARDGQKAEALKMALQLMTDPKRKQQNQTQEDMAVLAALMKAQGGVAGKEIAVAMLRRLGRSQDEIRALFEKLPKQ